MPELAKHFTGRSKLVFLDRTPWAAISQSVRRQPHVHAIDFVGGSLEHAIQNQVLDGYHYRPPTDQDGGNVGGGGHGETSMLNSTHDSSNDDPIVVFMSTYYSSTSTPGVCTVLMYHDLIP